MEILIIAAVIWLLAGLVAFVTARRHSRMPKSSWWIAALGGPLALAFLPAENMPSRVRWQASGTSRDQGLSLLAAIDQSPESEAAYKKAIELLGEQLGHVSLVTVVPPQARDAAERWSFEESAKTTLRQLAVEVAGVEPDIVVLEGPPDEALLDHIAAGSFDLVSAGRSGKGQGLSGVLMGSVATTLARKSPTPVLIGDK